jgi:hypothetical protein
MVMMARQLVDELGLDVFRARGVAIHHLGAADVDVQLVDLRQQVVGAVDVGLDPAVHRAAEFADLAVDPAGLGQEILDVGDRLAALQGRGRIVGRRGEGREGLVEAIEEEGVARRVAEQRLGVVEVLGKDIPAAGIRRRAQAGELQVLVGHPRYADDLDAHADAVHHHRPLVDRLADVARRVDVGDVVRDRAQTGLGSHHARCRGVQRDVERHARISARQRWTAKPANSAESSASALVRRGKNLVISTVAIQAPVIT